MQQVLGTQKVLENWRHVVLSPLNPTESRQLISSVLSRSNSEDLVLDQIIREGGGHPLFLQQLALGAATGSEAVGFHRGELTLQAILQRRVSELSAAAREMLEYVCIAAQPLQSRILFALTASAEATESGGVDALETLIRDNFARISGTADDRRVEPFHDQIRSATWSLISPGLLRLRHSGLAEALSNEPDTEPEVLVTHLREAGNSSSAHEYALRAASSAEGKLAFDRAAVLLQIAIDTIGDGFQHRSELYRRLADALSNAGRGADAANAYLEAAAHNPQHRLEFRRRAADQLMRSGHLDEALAILESLTCDTGIRIVRRPWEATLRILLGRMRVRFRLLLGVPKPTDARIQPIRITRLEMLRTAGVVLELADPVLATNYQVLYVLEAMKVREPTQLATALAMEASIRVATNNVRSQQAFEILRIAKTIAEDTRNANVIGFAYVCEAYVRYLLGHVKETIEHSEHAITFLRERGTGVAWELTAAYVLFLWGLSWAGDVARVSILLPQLLKEGAARGDNHVEVSLRLIAYTHYAYLSADQPEECLRESRRALNSWSRAGFHLQHYGALTATVETFLHKEHYGLARRELEDRWAEMERSFILRWEIIHVMVLFLRGRVMLGCWLEERNDRALYDEVQQCIRRLDSIGCSWRSPFVTTLRAGLAAGSGDTKNAIRLLEAAYKGLDSVSLNAYASAARYLCGKIRGDEEGRHLVRTATEFLNLQQVSDHVAFLRMLIPGEWIVAN